MSGFGNLGSKIQRAAKDVQDAMEDAVKKAQQQAEEIRRKKRNGSLSLDGSLGDYAIVKPVKDFPTTACTVSFWMRSANTSKSGTPVSYATSKQKNNELLLFDYRNLTPHIGGKKVVSGVGVNDGNWHHVAFSWRSTDGRVRVYVDGKRRWQGTLAPGYTLQGGGALVIGQEQDTVGGGFDDTQAFKGRIEQVVIWKTERTLDQVRAEMYHGVTESQDLAIAVSEYTAEAQGTTWQNNVHTNPRDPGMMSLPLNGTTAQYAILNPVSSFPSDAATVSFWLKTNDDRDGTVVSYATTASSNALLIFDYGNLTPHINQAKAPTGIAVNDGQWHHVATTWRSTDGRTRVYVDGVQRWEGTLAQGQKIQNGGSLVIGQDQDKVGGGFQATQAFKGILEQVALWRVERSAEQIYDEVAYGLTTNEPGLSVLLSETTKKLVVKGTAWGPTTRPSSAPAQPAVGGATTGLPTTGTPTGESTTTSETPEELSELGEFSFKLFSVPFKTPLSFDGAITVQPMSKAVTYSGAAHISAPFSLSVDPLEISILAEEDEDAGQDKPGYVVKFGLPRDGSLADLVEREVKDELGAAWAAFEALIMPYLRIYDGGVIIIASADGEDDDLGNFVGGFNAFTTVAADAFEPFHALNAAFPQLNLQDRTIVLGVGARDSQMLEYIASAALMLNVELGTKLVELNSIALNVEKGTTDASAGADIQFTVTLDKEALLFRGGIEASTGASASLTVWGALDMADGDWKDPFGFKGITIGGMGIQVGATTGFPYVTLGARGELHIGDGLLGGRVGILIDPGDISKCILDIYSKEGLDLPRLIDAVTDSSIKASKLLDVAVTNIQIYIAPNGGTIAGKSYDPGFAFGGTLDLWGWDASLEGMIDYMKGGLLKGSMERIRLKPLKNTTFLEITNSTGGDPEIDVEFTSNKIGGTIDAQVNILNTFKRAVTFSLSSKGFSGKLSSSGVGIYGGASITVEEGNFEVSFSPTIGVDFTVARRRISLSVSTTISAQVTTTKFKQSVSFSYKAFGSRKTAGPFTVNLYFSSAEDLAKAFKDFCEDEVVNFFTNTLRRAGEEAFRWVKANVTASAKAAAKFFKDVGANSAKIAEGLVDTFGSTAEQAVGYLSLGAEESAKILKKTFGKSAKEVGKFLTKTAGYSNKAATAALKGAGYAVKDVNKFLKDVAGVSDKAAKDLLKGAGYATKEVDKFFKDAGSALDPTKW